MKIYIHGWYSTIYSYDGFRKIGISDDKNSRTVLKIVRRKNLTLTNVNALHVYTGLLSSMHEKDENLVYRRTKL